MDVSEMFDRMPFNERLGIEVIDIGDGYAIGELELGVEHSSNPDRVIAHGGVAYALADTVAGAAVVAANMTVTPTIDMRIDYLTPATGGTLRAEAEIVRNGNSVATVEVTVTDDEKRTIAMARGTYKTSGVTGETAWRDDPTA
ncbi:MAG: PaaI family thioesterase [Halobacteriota archaeon]